MRHGANDSKRKQFPSTRSLFRCATNVFDGFGRSDAAIAAVAALGPFQPSLEMSTTIEMYSDGRNADDEEATATRSNDRTKKERDLPANKKRQNFALFFRISSRLAEVRSTLLCQRRLSGRVRARFEIKMEGSSLRATR